MLQKRYLGETTFSFHLICCNLSNHRNVFKKKFMFAGKEKLTSADLVLASHM